MVNSTSVTYQIKREILNFSNKISRHLSELDKKLAADMTYGMLTTGNRLLTDIVDKLHEFSKKVNSVKSPSRHLNQSVPQKAMKSYLATVSKWVREDSVIHIDDNDVIKPDGRKFETLEFVRDGSKSTDTKKCL